MTLGTLPRPVIEISELTQLFVDHLLLDSPKSLVSLACTCRALEEQPVVRTIVIGDPHQKYPATGDFVPLSVATGV